MDIFQDILIWLRLICVYGNLFFDENQLEMSKINSSSREQGQALLGPDEYVLSTSNFARYDE